MRTSSGGREYLKNELFLDPRSLKLFNIYVNADYIEANYHQFIRKHKITEQT